MPTPFGSLFSGVRGGVGGVGPGASRGHLFLGLSPPRGEHGAPLQSTLSQAARLALGYLLVVFPAGGPFLQCPEPRCGVDGGCLLNRSCIGLRGICQTRDVPRSGGGSQARQTGALSELEFGFFLFGAPPRKPAGLSIRMLSG